MSVYISLIEAENSPRLVRARGIIHSIEDLFEINTGLTLFTTDEGWSVYNADRPVTKLIEYGSATLVYDSSSSNAARLSMLVQRYQSDFNPNGSLHRALEVPIATIAVGMLGMTYSNELRVGDSVAIGSSLFPLPSMPHKSVADLRVISESEIRINPREATHLDNMTISGEYSIKPSDYSFTISGDSWLVTISPYTARIC